MSSLNHSVVISDNFGNTIKEFKIKHTQQGFNNFFKIIEKETKKSNVSIFNSYGRIQWQTRPLDSQILKRGYNLYILFKQMLQNSRQKHNVSTYITQIFIDILC